MIDPVEPVRVFMQINSALTAVTRADADHGIYRTPPGLPAGAVVNGKPPKCVVIQQIPGPSAGSYPHIEPRFYVKAYAPTGPAAAEVFGRVWDVFHNADGTARGPVHINNRWLMKWCNLDTGMAGIEDDGWPFMVATLQTAFDPLVGAL